MRRTPPRGAPAWVSGEHVVATLANRVADHRARTLPCRDVTLDRQAPCPSCGAPIVFKFGNAQAQVCAYCRAVVARTDRGLYVSGRMAELLELPSPLVVGTGGFWGGRRFEVEGRVQMDRAERASAPWQEILVSFPDDGSYAWLAHAQGRWYATRETPAVDRLPGAAELRPGAHVYLGGEAWVVQEVGARRVVSGEGAQTGVPRPGVVTRYADISAQGDRFGTIDYGDGSAPPVLFLGKRFDPTELRPDSGVPLEQPGAQATALDCPTCAAALPLLSQAAERVICQYCGTASDVTAGALRALGPSPRPPFPPVLPIGAQGVVRGVSTTVCGFMRRSCTDEGEVTAWTEYLLWGGAAAGYCWLVDEDGEWSLVTPIEAGDVVDAGSSALYRGKTYSFKHMVGASVDCVVGEFYWRVEAGDEVDATELTGPGGKISRESSDGEVNYSWCVPFDRQELAAFGVAPPPRKFKLPGGDGSSTWITWAILIAFVILIVALDECDGCGGGGSYHGGSGFGFGGK